MSVLLLLEAEFLEAQRVDFNKTGGVGGAEAFEGVHRGILLVVEVASIA